MGPLGLEDPKKLKKRGRLRQPVILSLTSKQCTHANSSPAPHGHSDYAPIHHRFILSDFTCEVLSHSVTVSRVVDTKKALAVCIRMRSCVRYRYINFKMPVVLGFFGLKGIVSSCRPDVWWRPNISWLPSTSLTQPCLFPHNGEGQKSLIGAGSQPVLRRISKPFDICWMYPGSLDLVERELACQGSESSRISGLKH